MLYTMKQGNSGCLVERVGFSTASLHLQKWAILKLFKMDLSDSRPCLFICFVMSEACNIAQVAKQAKCHYLSIRLGHFLWMKALNWPEWKIKSTLLLYFSKGQPRKQRLESTLVVVQELNKKRGASYQKESHCSELSSKKNNLLSR